MTQKIKLTGLLLLALTLSACWKSSPARKAEDSQPPAPGETHTPAPAAEAPATELPAASGHAVKTEMRNVMFHLTDQAAVHVETLSGELLPAGKREMPVFDDKTSFEVGIVNGRISITPQAMASLLNTHVFARNDSPFKDISISIEKDRLLIKGKLHTKGDIPFETTATLSTTSDGRIRVSTEKLKAMHLPMKGMMDKFGIELGNLISTSKIPGMVTDKDDVLMDLAVLLPPPHIRGKASRVWMENNAIVTIFGQGAPSAATMEAASYMTFQGNRVRLGKLIMEDADLTVLNLDSGDAIDWSQDHYRDQLVAGYTKMTPSFGLRAYVKDYARLSRSAGAPAAAPPKN